MLKLFVSHGIEYTTLPHVYPMGLDMLSSNIELEGVHIPCDGLFYIEAVYIPWGGILKFYVEAVHIPWDEIF